MAKRFIITPISEDGTVGRAIYVHKTSKLDKVLEFIGVVMVSFILICMVLFVLHSAIEVYW